MNLNKNCPDFKGSYTCSFFNSDGTCSHEDRFMCHIFMDTDKQPVEDDVPLEVGMILEAFPGSRVVGSKVLKRSPREVIEDIFGKL